MWPGHMCDDAGNVCRLLYKVEAGVLWQHSEGVEVGVGEDQPQKRISKFRLKSE